MDGFRKYVFDILVTGGPIIWSPWFDINLILGRGQIVCHWVVAVHFVCPAQVF